MVELFYVGLGSNLGEVAYQINEALLAFYHSKNGASMLIPFGFVIVETGSTNEKVI
jgi:7,8-dihydro-6-hydroxymethylpterin-pyrophosphokinase